MLNKCSKEIANLLENQQLLFENNHFYIVYGYAEQIPTLLPLLGKLREDNFRLVGEGTGKEIDLDSFDEFYTHIIVWDKRAQIISAAARIGKLDELYATHGLKGIYTYLEFEFDQTFIEANATTVEVSRLFVNSKTQKNFYGLYLMFSGLTRWLYHSKKYTSILGSVSISKMINPELHAILAEYCMTYRLNTQLQPLVVARKNYDYKLDPEHIKLLHEAKPKNFNELEKFMQKTLGINDSIPVLFKKYDLFKSNYICFAVDDDFSSVTDGLILTELSHSNPKVLEKFIGGKDRANDFCQQ
jgi:hypothetical protein